jgi:hypothetical protein
MHGVTDPSQLSRYEPAAACKPFADALQGKSDLMAVFREMAVEECKTAKSISKCVDETLANDARVHVLAYGWHNCANNYRIEVTQKKRLEQMHAQLAAQARRLFKVKELKCEPGS